MKRLFDLVVSAVGMLAIGPVLLWITWRIRREDGGPVFYRGVRVGLHGEPME